MHKVACVGNIICDDVRRYFDKVRPGALIICEASNANSKSDRKTTMSQRTFREVKE